jgi:hypothetical protein
VQGQVYRGFEGLICFVNANVETKCRDLGVLYDNGFGVPEDRPKR